MTLQLNGQKRELNDGLTLAELVRDLSLEGRPTLDMHDVWLMLVFGIVGYLMRKLDYVCLPTEASRLSN